MAVIGIDIDDVLADTLQSFITFHNQRYGSALLLEQFTSYQWEEALGTSRTETWRRIEEFFAAGGVRNIPPIAGAQNVLLQLGVRHTLIGVTSRAGIFEEVTPDWLEEHFPSLLSAVHYTMEEPGHRPGKAQTCLLQKVDVMIEDQALFSMSCAEAGVRVLLLDRPWNRAASHERITRVTSWTEIPGVLERLGY